MPLILRDDARYDDILRKAIKLLVSNVMFSNAFRSSMKNAMRTTPLAADRFAAVQPAVNVCGANHPSTLEAAQ
jgi:hypothetical protein